MSKCSCHHIEKYYHNGYLRSVRQECWGTKERDECSCGGDRTKCDFYPEVREKALKEIELKFGEWISVEDRLPAKNQEVLVYRRYHSDLMNVYTYLDNDEWEDNYGYWSRTNDEGITHWMLLPRPPKGE